MRRLLTEGAKEAFVGDAELLEMTKPWRGKLWRHFNVIAGRMMPCNEDGGPAPPMEVDDEDAHGGQDA